MGQVDASVAPASQRAGDRSSVGALLRACRPRQWTKNVLVVAAPGAAGVIGHGDAALDTVQAFIVLCLLSSATYLVNDVRDVEDDRRHPRKRLRPIAAGELSPVAALRAAVVLAAGGLAIAFAVRPLLGVVALAYLTLTSAYSLRLRHVAWVDLFVVACGFVLRAIAGGAAAGIGLSRWFLLVISFGALFIVAGKRLSELVRVPPAARTRAALARYTPRALAVAAALAALGMCVAFGIWALRRPEREPYYEAALAVLLLWVARYGVLLARGGGEAPEEVVLGDPILVTCGAGLVALLVTAVYAH